jgi:hypothetical protein
MYSNLYFAMCVMFVVVCVNKQSIQLRQSFQSDLWMDFLAGRVPRRKNFAGSFLKTVFSRVKQGFLDERTYSQTENNLKASVEILPRCANCFYFAD